MVEIINELNQVSGWRIVLYIILLSVLVNLVVDPLNTFIRSYFKYRTKVKKTKISFYDDENPIKSNTNSTAKDDSDKQILND